MLKGIGAAFTIFAGIALYFTIVNSIELKYCISKC
jgi:hypothetical protein